MKVVRTILIVLTVFSFSACKDKTPEDTTLDMSQLLIIVEKDNLKGLVNQQGQTIVELEYNDIVRCGRYYLAEDDDLDILDYTGTIVSTLPNASINVYSNRNCPSAIADTPLDMVIPFTQNESTGFARLNGDIIIEAQYKLGISFPDKGLARVVNDDNKPGYIDFEGNIIVDFDHANLGYLQDDRIIASKDGLFGVYDTSGTVVVPFEYKYISEYNDGIALASKTVETRYLYGAIDTEGTEVIDFEYEFLASASNASLFMYQVGMKFGYLDYQGTEVIPPNYASPLNFGKLGFAHYFDGSKVYLFGEDGSTVFEFFGEKIYRADELGRYYVIFNNNTYFLYDNEGTKVLQSERQINYVYDDYIFFIDEELDKQGFMDQDLTVIFDQQAIVLPASRLDFQIYRVQFTDDEELTYRFIDRHGDYINDETYDNAYTITPMGLIPVANDGLWGFINSSGDIVLPLQYDGIEVEIDIS